MLIKSKRERAWFIATILVAVISLGYVGYTEYQERREQVEQELIDLQEEYRRGVKILIDLKNITARHQRITEDLRLEGGEMIWRIRIREEIDQFLEKAGITNRGSTSPEDPVYHDDVGAMEYRFRIEGLITTMPDLARFLSLLEEESAVLEVKELDLMPTDRRRGGNYGIKVVRMIVSRIVFTDTEGGELEGEA